ncbi:MULTISPECIES: ArsR/SmtB family transcription factor [unclassified Paenibacillus]|uniref:ArsR/SmtB family transcription factor n=1 Tax=unclassified Paenibacillus TaxID=185978 RepID=UPI003FA76503
MRCILKLNKLDRVEAIKKDFKLYQKVFLALGDENRQSIITVLMETTCIKGMRVGEIAEKTHLSRPAVSHHLRILREAEIILMRQEGSKNYYFIDLRTKLGDMKNMFGRIDELLQLHY